MRFQAKVVVAAGFLAACTLFAENPQALADTAQKASPQNQQSTVQNQAQKPKAVVKKTAAHKTHSTKIAEAPLPPYTPKTLPPLPLEQMPSVPPEVAYKDGKLSIVAHNSTLGDILHAVHAKTGADLDVPASANERVVATLGPGPARDVLATLLNGTRFNYVMLGSPADPSSVQRVVLTAKTGPEIATSAANVPQPNQGMPPNRFQQPMMAPGADQDAQAAEDNSADAQDDSNAEATDDQAQGDQQQGDPQQQQQNGQQGPKTPEQLLQELQRQQQMMQQQQQQAQPGQPQMAYPNPTQPQPESAPEAAPEN